MESRTDQETGRRSILVVDSDAQTQRILDLSLRNAGFDVKTAGDASEALAWLADHRADLVVADTQLPGAMDGFELCRRVKQRPDGPAVPFVFLAEPKVESKVRGVEAGADDFLTKPVYVQEVVGRARALLQRRERVRLETLAQSNERFTGDLGDIPLVDLVRTVEANRKSGVAHLLGPEGLRGEIYFRQGAVVDGEVGRLSGREAIYRLFSWPGGRFEVEWKSIRRKDAVGMEPSALLMEALRRVEEWRQLLADVPPLDTVFEVDYRLLAERLAEIPDEVNSILRLFDGVRTFIQVIDDCGLGDLEALPIIGKLYRERIIRDAKLKGDGPEAGGADIEGWLSDAGGPFRSTPERARRDLFGAGPEAAGAGVHGRPTAPLEPLEEGGREPLGDDMRARFTDRLNTDERPAAPGAPSLAEPAARPAQPPLTRAPAPVMASEITLQGVGMTSPRPITSPGFAAAVMPPHPALPDVTPVRGTKPPQTIGTGDGIPEAVPPVEGEPAIVVPDASSADMPRPPAAAAPPPLPNADELRVVAGEIVSRALKAKARESRASEERLAVLRETVAPSNRATEPGLGPHGTAPLRPLETEVVAPLPPRTAGADNGAAVVPYRRAEPDEFSEREAADELGVPSRARGVLLVLAVVVLGAGGIWALGRRRGTGEASRAGASSSSAVREPVAVVPVPTGGAPAPQAQGAAGASGATTSAASAAVPAPAETAHGGHTAPPRPHAPPPGSAAEGTREELDERAADPKVARALPEEFPQLLSACRTAFTEKRMKDAEVACAAAKDANPESAEAYGLMAHALFNRNHRHEALSWAERAVKIDPNLADAYVIIGGVRQDDGDRGGAKAAYRKYLELAPSGQYAADLRAIVDSL